MLRSLEPVINRSFIERAPGNMGIGWVVSAGYVAAVSEAAAALLSAPRQRCAISGPMTSC